MELSHALAESLVRSNEEFPVDFDDAWQWIGYFNKQAAKKKLTNNFEKGIDYSSKWIKTPDGGRPSQYIILTIDCFKSLAMMAGTEKGREVRGYFLDCERRLRQQEKQLPPATSRLTQLEFDIQSGLALVEQGKSVVWQAVAQIQDEELWRDAGFRSFADYCKERWGWSRSNAYEIAAAGKVVNQLKEIGIPSENLPTAIRQVRPLRRFEEPLRPDIWKQVLETTQAITAELVERTVNPPKLKAASNLNQITAYVGDALRVDLERLAKRRRRSLSSLIETICYEEVEIAKAQGEL